ncbi:MAG: hypothetical protein ACXAC6_16310 [Candidatus Hodarchaeales archaeon]|jgi:hypothetical protein
MKKIQPPRSLISVNKRLHKKRRGSPLVEEGILIGLSLFGFLLIFSIITGVLDWLIVNADELLRQLGTLFS